MNVTKIYGKPLMGEANILHCPNVKLVKDFEFETEKDVLLAGGAGLALSPYRASTGVPPMGEASLILPPSRCGYRM